MHPTGDEASRRVRARVDGTVQGVGFRPFVYRLATELGISGWVANDERGVIVEAEGPSGAVQALLARLSDDAPPLADVRNVAADELEPTGALGFAIAASARAGVPSAPVAPDSATCEDCLAELTDPADRRHRYPFINCTNCGPRLTIIRGVPYDRPRTTMAGFTMCAACQAEYDDPGDRRFHAQPNACAVCGPRARLLGSDAPDAVAAAAGRLLAGAILAIKGLGGYHLACRADDERAVATLRERKHREDRPFAIMVDGPQAADQLVTLDAVERALLLSRERPIVLARRRPAARVAAALAPDAPDLGILLPYTPLHHLLLADCGVPLVMTSGNVSDEPIAYDDRDARDRLATIADDLLVHDRPIHTRTDDSVVRVVRGRPLMLRRSRGYVPRAIELAVPAAVPVLGCGAEQKNVFCLARGRQAWPSHHIGDLKNYETLTALQDGVAHFERLFAVVPQIVAHDLHPDYLSTRYAQGREGVTLLGVQHHHAHLAACLAEHGEIGPVVAAIYDGTGYGPDGTVWGGELLVGDLVGFERAGHVRAVRMPGGERAIREPWRMACAWLVATHGGDVAPPPGLADIDPVRWRAAARMADTGLSAPVTTSMGRLFDAVAALAGVRDTVTYEGQAAVELEAAAAGVGDVGAYELPVLRPEPGGPLVLDPAPLIAGVLSDLAAGRGVGVVAGRFHAAVAEATARACGQLASARGLQTVVLAGGVFQNRTLLESTADALETAGLRVLVPERLPCNDGAIAFGQVAVAAATSA